LQRFNSLLWSVFITATGVFMPWKFISEQFTIRGGGATRLGSRIVGHLPGYVLPTGWAVLTLSGLLLLLVTFPLETTTLSEKQRSLGQLLAGLVGAIVVVEAITLLATGRQGPHIGMLASLVGSALALRVLRSRAEPDR